MAGAFSHPGIISIFERGMHHGRPYLVMPFVDGHPPRAPLPSREAARIAQEVAQALAHVHERGVIHRDVKPSNILIAEENGAPRAMLTDFGIGQLVSKETAAGITHLGFTQTMMAEDSMTGTQLYLAPEMLAGQPATIRSDIYALGVIAYELFAGTHPFRVGREENEVMTAHRMLLDERVPLGQIADEVFAKFPLRVRTWERALARVADLSIRYGEAP
jgi:serine/threonine protein kinase